MIHHPTHWIAVAVAAMLALMAIEASGDTPSTGAAAVFEGRPSMAGAQGGLGAQAGPPTGGIGVEGNEAATLSLRPPRMIEEVRELRAARKVEAAPLPVVVVEDPVIAANNTDMLLFPQRVVRR